MSEPAQKRGRSKQDYATPWEFVKAAAAKVHIRKFWIDLAASDHNTKADVWIRSDSLAADWSMPDGEWAWLNPPFDNIAPWAEKCAQTARDNKGRIAFLVPAAVGANWFRDYVYRAHAHTLFLNGRITFDGCTDPYPKDCMLVLYGFGYQWNDIWTWRSGLSS
jgi:phage N-6-adenine-methyltransferase